MVNVTRDLLVPSLEAPAVNPRLIQARISVCLNMTKQEHHGVCYTRCKYTYFTADGHHDISPYHSDTCHKPQRILLSFLAHSYWSLQGNLHGKAQKEI
jgi:hypothetical protein